MGLGTTNKYNVLRLAADGQLNSTNPIHIVGILLVGGTANSKLEISEDGDGSGTNVLVVNALANDCKWVDLSMLGGINLEQGYGDLTGTGAEAYIFWE